jgi:predicted transcriptional regulator
MFTAEINGKTITAKTVSELKRKASTIANNRFDVIDTMKVISGERILTFKRFNKVYPNNKIERGVWK